MLSSEAIITSNLPVCVSYSVFFSPWGGSGKSSGGNKKKIKNKNKNKNTKLEVNEKRNTNINVRWYTIKWIEA